MTDPLNWGDGDYARTAETLMPAAEVLVEAAGVGEGDDVLDVACGTGNVSLAASQRGERVTGVDGADVLVDAARERVPGGEFHVGEAEALPVDYGAFDIALSAFGVIFSPDPDRAAAELVRATRAGGRIAITTWDPAGAIHTAGTMLAAEVFPPRSDPPRWGDAAWVTALLERNGADDVVVGEEQLTFAAKSPAHWFAEQEEHHPVWRWGRRQLDDTGWERLRARSVAVLADGNEDPAAFRTTSRYLVITARRPEA